MIYTSSYKEGSKLSNTISISADKGKKVDYEGPYYRALAPKKIYWNVWHNNINKIPDIDNNRYYVYNYIKYNLIGLDPVKVYEDLDTYTLLCYELYKDFCHRHIVALYLEDMLGIKIYEIMKYENSIIHLERPDYIKELYDSSKYLLKK